MDTAAFLPAPCSILDKMGYLRMYSRRIYERIHRARIFYSILKTPEQELPASSFVHCLSS